MSTNIKNRYQGDKRVLKDWEKAMAVTVTLWITKKRKREKLSLVF